MAVIVLSRDLGIVIGSLLLCAGDHGTTRYGTIYRTISEDHGLSLSCRGRQKQRIDFMWADPLQTT